MNKKQSTHPAWALAFKKPGTKLRCIRGRFYIYEYKTVYDNVRKRPKKISGKLLCLNVFWRAKFRKIKGLQNFTHFTILLLKSQHLFKLLRQQ